ncbi:MAG: hypothetical protein E2O99_02970 [Acidobacteria bacterium]|nr:MAG: hypothetical protein E2O99_02970 [Acidobacteriota bacterium]
MLGLISAAVVSQALGLVRTMPGVRRIWRRAALARQGRAQPSPQRPLLAQADARSLLPDMSPSAQHRGGGGLRSAATTASWVALTISIMAAAILGTGLVARSALRSIEARGWGLGSLLGLGVTGLVGYGVTIMSIGLIRSWFERRRRRLSRMLMRLSRYLLRGADRSTTVLPRMPIGVDGAVGFLGRSVLATGGAAVAVAASVAIPVMAMTGTTTIWDGLASTSPSISVVVNVGNDDGTAVPIAAAGGDQPHEGGAETVLSDTLSNATASPIAGSTTTTNETTTTTIKTITTTTSSSRDATGPVVSDISDTPDPILTAGNKQDTSQITVTTTDKSGVATVTVHYRISGGTFAIWTTLKPGTATTTFGPFTKPGIYEYRIMATDTLGNTNCKTPDTCPGGTVTVVTR